MKKITDKNGQFNNAEFGAESKFGTYSEFGAESKFGAYSEFDAESKFGECSKFGDNSKFDHGSEFDAYAEFGAYSKFGAGCSYRGFVFEKFMLSANIDGSGRQIKIFSAGKIVMVEAGCFWGTAEEFCNRAKNEGKNIYANIVGAIAKAIVK